MTISPQRTPIQPPTGFTPISPEDPGPLPEYMAEDLYLGVEYDVQWNHRDGVQVLAGRHGLHVQSRDILAAAEDLLALYVKVRNAELEHAANVARQEAQR